MDELICFSNGESPFNLVIINDLYVTYINAMKTHWDFPNIGLIYD